MVKNWVKRTPDNFRFTVKFPKVITHDKLLVDVEDDVERFLENIIPLEKKTLALLIQLPPSLEIMQGLEGLRNLCRITFATITFLAAGSTNEEKIIAESRATCNPRNVIFGPLSFCEISYLAILPGLYTVSGMY